MPEVSTHPRELGAAARKKAYNLLPKKACTITDTNEEGKTNLHPVF